MVYVVKRCSDGTYLGHKGWTPKLRRAQLFKTYYGANYSPKVRYNGKEIKMLTNAEFLNKYKVVKVDLVEEV